MPQMADDLLETLRRLETELHQHATQCDRERMKALLHPQFREFGRSGREYDRDFVLKEFSTDNRLEPVQGGISGSSRLAKVLPC
jgi:hypothetical protein